jgi:hypothetical protein
MSYYSLPKRYPGMYRVEEESGLWVPIRAKAKKDPLCQVAFCTRLSEKTAKTGRGLVCGVCRVRIWRANNPIRAIYNAVKNKARRRSIPFDLELGFFTELCQQTGYHQNRGRALENLHIDRIDALRGYHNDNVQIITAEENLRKRDEEQTRSCEDWEEYAAGYERDPEAVVDSGEDPF